MADEQTTEPQSTEESYTRVASVRQASTKPDLTKHNNLLAIIAVLMALAGVIALVVMFFYQKEAGAFG